MDKTAPYVTVGGQQVETMTFSQGELIGRAEYPPVFAIYLNEHIPLETSIGRGGPVRSVAVRSRNIDH